MIFPMHKPKKKARKANGRKTKRKNCTIIKTLKKEKKSRANIKQRNGLGFASRLLSPRRRLNPTRTKSVS
jgi:hypothetical protein